MVFLSPPNSNGLLLSTFQARTNPPLTRALARPLPGLVWCTLSIFFLPVRCSSRSMVTVLEGGYCAYAFA